MFSFHTLCNLNARGVLRSAEKKTQPLRPGGAWVRGLWEIVEYVLADKGRKHQVEFWNKALQSGMKALYY